VAEPPQAKASSDFDFSKVDFEKEWECFGTIEPDHPECKGCPAKEKCAEKAGVSLK